MKTYNKGREYELRKQFVNEEVSSLLSFSNRKDNDELEIPNLHSLLKENKPLLIKNLTQQCDVWVNALLTERQTEIILNGGLLNYTKKRA